MKKIHHIYTRVSSAVQEEGTSLETQKELGIKKSKELGMNFQIWNEGAASSSGYKLVDGDTTATTTVSHELVKTRSVDARRLGRKHEVAKKRNEPTHPQTPQQHHGGVVPNGRTLLKVICVSL